LWLDFYDNYESFLGSKLPGVLKSMRSAAQIADGISCVSNSLSVKLKKEYAISCEPIVIPNGIDSDRFNPIDKQEARAKLNLPTCGTLVGTAGALDGSRDLKAALTAVELLRREQQRDVQLVLAGKPRLTISPRNHVIALGNLAFGLMPAFWSSLDVAIVSILNDDFGRYCFPLKLAEARACNTPLVCANVGVLKELICQNDPVCFKPREPASLASALDSQLTNQTQTSWRPEDWREIAQRLSSVMQALV